MKSIPEYILKRKQELLQNIKLCPSGCWEWTGKKSPRGYGVFVGMFRAHRVFYALYKEQPTGFVVCHHCDNPPCVNPEHLFLGTALDNTQDMINKNRQKKWKPFEKSSVITESVFLKLKSEYENNNVSLRKIALDNGILPAYLLTVFKLRGVNIRLRGKKLGEPDVVLLRKMCSEFVPRKKIAEHFGIHRNAVSAIYNGHRWGHFKTPYDPW